MGFLKFSDLIRLSRPVFGFPYRPPGCYVLRSAKCVCFYAFYSSLGQTRLCPKECSIVKQRFSVILWHFLEHFQSFSAVFHPRFLSVLANRQRLGRVCLPALCLLQEDSFDIPHFQHTWCR